MLLIADAKLLPESERSITHQGRSDREHTWFTLAGQIRDAKKRVEKIVAKVRWTNLSFLSNQSAAIATDSVIILCC